jgi:hypothetical protein
MSMRYGRNNPWRTFESSILEARDLSVYEKMAYIVISSHATATDQRSWPSYSTIATKGSMSVRKAKDAVKSLEEKNLIVKVHRFTNRTRNGKEQNEYTSNLYIIFPHCNPFDPSKEMINGDGDVISISSAQYAQPSAPDARPPSAQHAQPLVHSMHLKNKTNINKTNIINKTTTQNENHVVVVREKYESLFQKKLTKKQAEDLITLADKHQVDLIKKMKNTYDIHRMEPRKRIVGAIKWAIENGDWEIASSTVSKPLPKAVAMQLAGKTKPQELTREQLEAKKLEIQRKIAMLEEDIVEAF